MAIVSSLLMLLVLVVVVGLPLVLGLGAARSNARYAYNEPINRLFWGVVGGYLVGVGILGVVLVVAATQHPHGPAAAWLTGIVGFLALPGSILPLVLDLGSTFGWLPHPLGLPNSSAWFVVASMCWQFFVIVGFRWQLQWRGRSAARELRVRPAEQGEPATL
jgi:hypothetical protein